MTNVTNGYIRADLICLKFLHLKFSFLPYKRNKRASKNATFKKTHPTFIILWKTYCCITCRAKKNIYINEIMPANWNSPTEITYVLYAFPLFRSFFHSNNPVRDSLLPAETGLSFFFFFFCRICTVLWPHASIPSKCNSYLWLSTCTAGTRGRCG